jgi:hypothetical protein
MLTVTVYEIATRPVIGPHLGNQAKLMSVRTNHRTRYTCIYNDLKWFACTALTVNRCAMKTNVEGTKRQPHYKL